jgi:hypothetical protein
MGTSTTAVTGDVELMLCGDSRGSNDKITTNKLGICVTGC